MSSLAATQADGYYIPPSYIESGAYKKKSISQHAGSKGHNQYLQRSVCRFELPFDGFCTGCDAIVGKGTRFNTHKAHVDDYFTTKIYEFTTRCRACGKTEFKIRTNPKERTFDYVSGIRKKVEEFNSAEAGTHGIIDTDFGNGILQYKNGKVEGAPDMDATAGAASLQLLEKNVSGHRKVQTEHEQMESLLELNSKVMGDDYALTNASIRANFRKDRKAKKIRLGEAAGLGLGRGIELAVGTEEDAKLARRTMDVSRSRRSGERAHESERDKFRSVRTGSIFGEQTKSSKRKGRHTNTPKKEDANVKSNVYDNADRSRAKKKILIGGQKLEMKKQQSKAEDATESPGDGALAALSNLYASDSD